MKKIEQQVISRMSPEELKEAQDLHWKAALDLKDFDLDRATLNLRRAFDFFGTRQKIITAKDSQTVVRRRLSHE